jgi:hypothetical protein
MSSSLLQRVTEAFVKGQECPPSETVGKALSQYSELLEASIATRMPEEEWSFVQSCAHQHHKTLQAAQQHRLDEARQLADEVWSRVRSRSLSLEGDLLVQVLLPPADAYLFYRLEQYDRARAVILDVSAVDHRLVTEFGYLLLSAHRLQLGHNLLRVHTRLAEHGEAVDLARTLLDYVELRVEPASGALLSPRATLDAVPDMVLEHYFDKICGEVAIPLAGSTDATNRALFQSLAHHAGTGTCPGNGFGSHAHAWLRLKRLALSGDVEWSLLTASDLLRRGRMSEAPLWFATIIEVAGICRSLGREGARLADDLIATATTFSDAPWVLKQPLVLARSE